MKDQPRPPGGDAISELGDPAVFRSLFAAHPDALLLVNAKGTIVLANPAASALLGYEPGEMLGMPVEALLPEALRSRHVSHRDQYMGAPRPRPMGSRLEFTARRKDGSEIFVDIALSPLQDHGLPYVVAGIRNVSSYPRVQQALQRARYSEHLAMLGRLAAYTRDIDALFDQGCEIAAVALQTEVAQIFLLESDQREFRVASATGAIASEPVGARVPNRPDTPPGFALSEGRPVTVADYREEARFTVPRGYLEAGLLSALAVPLSDRGRVIGALTVRSKVSKRFGEEEVRFLESLASLLATSLQRTRSEQALTHSQRLESVGHLTGGIAHDFNNLLTIIQGNLQVLEELPAVEDDPNARQLVASALRASRRGAELTGQLLAFSRRQMLQPAPIDVGAMMRSLADMLRRTLDQHIRIEVQVDDACPPVLADPAQLESALLNIAINARDAMPEGGTLRFHAEPCGELAPEARRLLDDPSSFGQGFIVIRISDTGVGMPDAVKERAFEPFFTTKDAGRGTGLGLSSVYGFVKQSRGAVAIESAPGEGTTVTLFIPQPWSAEERAEELDTAALSVPEDLHVLLVEDDAEVRSVVRTFLEALACRVTVAANGEHAALWLERGAPIDLLLTDVALGPGMRGTQLASQARDRYPGLPVLLMSGFSAELLDDSHAALPDCEVLRKPFSRAELARAMARSLAA
jgi:PAS domain S-box-containing protein